ncbi:hypothetical protein [Ekhidna sp.]|uniref:hypothetical protein n=1 Tax=Ekhidna sp. TaxID=2608089 RepID=UPI003515176A
MEKIVKIFSVLLLVVMSTSCGSDDSGPEISTEFDGVYYGVITDGSVQIGNYTMVIVDGQVSGSFNDGFESKTFSSTVNPGGTVFIEIAYSDGYTVSVTLSLQGGAVAGSWTDNEGGTGGVAGAPESTTFDGSYSGTASSGGTVIGSFSVTIVNGKITGTYTEDGETTAINGFVGSSGSITFNIFFSDGSVTSLNGTISGNTISGTFSYSEGGSGTFTGQKN